MDIRQQLLAAFEAEHREHLDAIRAGLAAAAESRAADWNDVFRRAHSLKGAARAVDLPPVEALAHRLEALFERVMAGRQALDRDAVAAVDLALDRIEAFVAQTGDGPAVMPGDALAALDACLAPAADSPSTAGSSPAPPSPAPLSPAAAAPSPAQPAAHPPAEGGGSVLRVPAAAVEALTRTTHELANALAGQGAVGASLDGLAEAAAALRRRTEALRAKRADHGSDELRAGLGDIEAALSALVREARELARRQRAGAAAVEGASGRLREEAERLALVPAETMFGGFARSLREIARGEGRALDVATRGLDLPVDRATLQALRDPVLHVLRNALGHGGEPPAIRRAAGKPEALSVLFEVEARGSRLVIAVHDDGAGPDLPGIARRARERGLLALVFEPGLSPATAVDTLSGRGMGLSVVAEAVRRLQGSVRLERRRPHGTSLVMDLPLSAARRPLLLVGAGGATYAVPSAAVERLLRLDRSALDTVAGRPVARVGEGEAALTLPVAALADLVGGAPAEAPATIPAVLLRAGSRRCLLGVERLHDVRTLLVLPAPPIGGAPDLVVGTVILGSETPVLVLDPDGVIARAGRAAGTGASKPASLRTKEYVAGSPAATGTMPQARRSTILVVDDSITTRTLEKSILEAAGYRVVVCVDGQDALERLRAGIEPVDLVVADVEMPRLDGFGLLKALRAQDAFASLPVILMTSRGAEEDVARGLELGADAYLTKQKFDQRELLDTVGQLV